MVYHALCKRRMCPVKNRIMVKNSLEFKSFLCNAHQTIQMLNCLNHRRMKNEDVNFHLHNFQ